MRLAVVCMLVKIQHVVLQCNTEIIVNDSELVIKLPDHVLVAPFLNAV